MHYQTSATTPVCCDRPLQYLPFGPNQIQQQAARTTAQPQTRRHPRILMALLQNCTVPGRSCEKSSTPQPPDPQLGWDTFLGPHTHPSPWHLSSIGTWFPTAPTFGQCFTQVLLCRGPQEQAGGFRGGSTPTHYGTLHYGGPLSRGGNGFPWFQAPLG